MSGYPFIRAFILSMMTDGNDDLLEKYFDKVGVESHVKIQYLLIRSVKTEKIKGFSFPIKVFSEMKEFNKRLSLNMKLQKIKKY